MDYGDIIDVLAAYRRPGTPVFAYHYLRLPAGLCSPANVPSLIAILEDADLPPKVRGHAAGALGQTGDRRALPALLAGLEQPRLRKAAALGLGLLAAPEAAEPLRELADRMPVAQWALEQARPAPSGGDTDAVLEDLQRGQLRAIGPKIDALSPRECDDLGRALVSALSDCLDARRLPGPWLLTALQYATPPEAGPLLARTAERAVTPEGRFIWNRLLRALGALAPMEAVAPLADAICCADLHPGGRQLAAVCLEKIRTRHGTPGARAVDSHGRRFAAALSQLSQALDETPRVEAERPWDHCPGTEGWRAESRRAANAIQRLVTIGREAERGDGCVS